MAKTFNLNPGSDATLVAAATRAAMANVPKDLSGTFESMAEEYGKTMREVGKSWAQVGKNLGTIGGQLADKAFKEIRTENENMGTLIEKEIEIEGPQAEEDAGKPGSLITLDPSDDAKPRKKGTQTTSLGQEMRSIRKELSSLYFKTDPKSSARKAELRKQKDKYYSEIAILKQENDVNNKLLADKNINLEATGSLNLALNLAIKEYPTKGGKIKEGKYEGYSASLSRNEDGDLSWILKDPSGTLVTGMDSDQNLVTTGGKPYKVPISEMNKTLTPKMDQKVVDNANKIITTAFDSGKSGVQYMGNQLVNKFRPLLDDEVSLQQLADVKLGDSATTLREQFNSESVYSAEIFAGISSVELQSMGAVDADNDNDVDKDDIFPKGGLAGNANAVANFKAVRSAIFDKNNDNYDDGRHLRSVTEKHIYNTGEIMHGVGKTLYRPPNNNNSGGRAGAHFFQGVGQVSDATFQRDYMPYVNFLNNPTEGQEMQSPIEKLKVKYQDGQFNVFDNNKEQYVPVGNAKDAAEYDQLSNYVSGPKKIIGGGGGGENPFGGTVANQAPDEFIAAVDQGEEDTVAYLEGMGIKVKDKFGDKVEVEINGQTKTFRVDPYLGNDASIANKMWKWMFENWTKKKPE